MHRQFAGPMSTAAEVVTRRKRISVKGIVQGVGFRPFVFQLAHELNLSGFVLNCSSGVIVEAEGPDQTLEILVRRLRQDKPPLARIDSLEIDDLPFLGDDRFSILASRPEEGAFALVPADVSTCADCAAEVIDAANRRFAYPFTNCTNCGPRYTIIRELPYDRPKTTMEPFVMCAACQAEYDDPLNRRFHAQPNACAACGPSLRTIPERHEPMHFARQSLANGNVLAIRGLGGFQLACDARNTAAIAALRARKRRSEKPFALMARNLAVVAAQCVVSREEAAALSGPEHPIVVLARRADCALPEELAPGNDTLGVMLPYTPLHSLLFRDLDLLVMTSGNISEEPIVIDNVEASERLGAVADVFLLHNREIHTRVDDSIVRISDGEPRLIRRARSFAPHPIDLGRTVPDLLACGAELKNTFCLTKDRYAFVSQHIGDLKNYETLTFFEQTLSRMKSLFHIDPIAVAHDLHPHYLSTRFAQSLEGMRTIGVQHHHAHIASCMAENGLREQVIGVAMDGTGYGTDGAIWGAEFLTADLASFERRAHFRYVPLAGGDTAIRQPWRSALAYLRDTFGDAIPSGLLSSVASGDRSLVERMTARSINTVPTSSCGRLFDAVAAVLGTRTEVTFEAQAAIELETLARKAGSARPYPFEVQGSAPMQIDFRPMFDAIVAQMAHEFDRSMIAARFHETLAEVIESICLRIREQDVLNKVCLSGGTFQNLLLLERTLLRLRARGFEVFLHRHVPCNDGGISLGQAAVAGERIERGE
ncbi:MAG: carbamoyltransferase HypF [Acidobacteriota bacterium]